ncbi:MAG: hypothetical protein QNJ14_12205 [Woeseiaceae bacterium]|nr:hypothetical protein [Woeseiaceae bacterium]
MLALIETLFDIVRLRKGPDAIPHSGFVFGLIVVLWFFSSVVMTVTTEELDDRSFLTGLIVGLIGLACYAAVVILAGRGTRILQTVAAILGCGALLNLMFVVGNVFLTPFIGANITNIIVTLILFWSIPVEGHIIARAIDRHWYAGIVIAMAVFVFQLIVFGLLDPPTPGVADTAG